MTERRAAGRQPSESRLLCVSSFQAPLKCSFSVRVGRGGSQGNPAKDCTLRSPAPSAFNCTYGFEPAELSKADARRKNLRLIYAMGSKRYSDGNIRPLRQENLIHWLRRSGLKDKTRPIEWYLSSGRSP